MVEIRTDLIPGDMNYNLPLLHEGVEADQFSSTWLSLQRFEACMASLSTKWEHLNKDLNNLQLENRRLTMELGVLKTPTTSPTSALAVRRPSVRSNQSYGGVRFKETNSYDEKHEIKGSSDVELKESSKSSRSSSLPSSGPEESEDEEEAAQSVNESESSFDGPNQPGSPGNGVQRREWQNGFSPTTSTSTTAFIRRLSRSSSGARRFTRTFSRTLTAGARWRQCFRRFRDKAFATREATLEFVAAVVIIINVILLGVSTSDIGWVGWTYVTTAFAIFYTAELLVKVWIHGYKTYFCGPSRFWNLFDTVLVGIAIVETVENLTHGSAQILKAMRVGRLTRLVRLLDFRICNDLSLMIARLKSGLKSLKGAMVLLGFTIWSVAVVLSMTVGIDEVDRFGGFYQERDILFSTASRATFTVFRCVTGDCYTSTGQPLAALMMEAYGWMFVLPYITCILVVTFGILNLVMASFIERTLTASIESKESKIEQPFVAARESTRERRMSVA